MFWFVGRPVYLRTFSVYNPRMQPLALVTGAAHRLGKIFALTLARNGYDILLHYHSAEDEARRTQAEIDPLGRISARADLTDPAQISSILSEVESLRVLVNSAAFMPGGNTGSLSIENWDTSLDLNLRAPFLLAQESAKKMTEGGLIVNITDVAHRKHGSLSSIRSASRAESLTRRCRAGAEIRVNAIAPGLCCSQTLSPRGGSG
jgi:pteridine reductase